MQVKRFEVTSVQEALERIKKDLGEEAVVLSTRRLPGRGGRLEVVAARDDNSCQEAPKMVPNYPGIFEELRSLKRELEEIKVLLEGVKRVDFGLDFVFLRENLEALFDVLGFDRRDNRNNCWKKLYYELTQNGVSKSKVLRTLEAIKKIIPNPEIDYEEALRVLTTLLEKEFGKRKKVERRIKFFIGPAGVGKTTTLAKIAARYALGARKKVGLLSMDTYRIGAIEQLKIYANLMEIPMEVATEREKFLSTLKKFSHLDYILVDTPGRGPAEISYLEEIKHRAGLEVETNLVVSLTASKENLIETAERYRGLEYDQLIITKLDEVSRFGSILDIAEGTEKPIVYLTTGQNVPADIEDAEPAKLAKLVLGRRY